jgi:hypothetical protein
MQHFSSSHAKQNFGDLLKATELGPVAVERHRKVQVIVMTPEHFAAHQQSTDPKVERRLARLNQALVERDRLIRHQKIAIELLTLPQAESAKLIDGARAMVERWTQEKLCSIDYIQRWSDILTMPLKQMAEVIVSDADGWGSALRQNSPWVGERA